LSPIFPGKNRAVFDLRTGWVSGKIWTMVLLKKLNKICSLRPVSRAIPAQIACRLLGNDKSPCPLDPICKPCEKSGVWLFYATIAGALSLVFLVIFWVLRITRLQKLLNWLFRLVSPPFKWLCYSFAGLYNFYRNLPF